MLLTPVTLQFKFPAPIPADWQIVLKRVWNRGLYLLEWRQQWNRHQKCESILPVNLRVEKHGEDWVMSCPLGREERIDRTKSWDKENVVWKPFQIEWIGEYPACPVERDIERYAYSSWDWAIPWKWLDEPPISGYGAIDVRKPFAQKRCEIDLGGVPQIYINDFIGLVLCTAWEQYLKGGRGKPKYKRDPVTSLVSESFRGQGEIIAFQDGKWQRCYLPYPAGLDYGISVPGFKFRVPDLYRRLLHPLNQAAAAMKTTPEQFPKLQEMLLQGIAYREIARGASPAEPDKYQKAAIKKRDSLIAKGKDAVSWLLEKAQELELDGAIAHLLKPGSFRIVEDAKGSYFQITAEMISKENQTGNSVGIDVGTDYLYVTTTGVAVPVQDWGKVNDKIERLQSRLSKLVYGSKNYEKLKARIDKLKRNKRLSTKKRQEYHAAWQSDRHQFIAIKQVDLKQASGRPIPKYDSEQEKYLPNGATEREARHKVQQDGAVGQFVAQLEQKGKAKECTILKVQVAKDATCYQVLEASGFQPGLSVSGKASSLCEKERGKHDGESSNATPDDRPTMQAPQLVLVAKSPKPHKSKRNRKRERRIG